MIVPFGCFALGTARALRPAFLYRGPLAARGRGCRGCVGRFLPSTATVLHAEVKLVPAGNRSDDKRRNLGSRTSRSRSVTRGVIWVGP